MLSFFRRNLFVNLVFLSLFVIALQAYYFIEYSEASLAFSLTRGMDLVVPFFTNPFVQTSLTIILILLQGVIISTFVIDHKMSRALSYIPGAVFALFASFVLEDHTFDPVLLANFFFVLSMGSIYNVYKKHQPVTRIFNAGFFVALASLIYFPYVLFLIVLILGLISLRSTRLVEILQLVIGFLSVYFLAAVVLYATGNLDQMSGMTSQFGIPDFDTARIDPWIKPVFVVVLIIILMLFHDTVEKKRTYDAIRKIDLNYYTLLLSAFGLLLAYAPSNMHLMMVSMPVALLGGLILERKEYALTKEFFFLLALAFYFALVFDLI